MFHVAMDGLEVWTVLGRREPPVWLRPTTSLARDIPRHVTGLTVESRIRIVARQYRAL